MSKTYGVGILGAGNISAAYLKLAPLFKGIEVRAVADIIPEAAKARADEFNVAAQTPDQLMANSELDVIVNLTIPDVHYTISKEIVSAGKHAYSEKPLVLSLEEGEDLRKAAQKAGKQIGCAPDTFLGGAHQQARALIDEGAIGRVTSGTCHVMSFGLEHWHPNPDFFFKPGAGPILDIGPYYVANLINLIGPVKRVTAFSSTPRERREITSEPRKGQYVTVETPTTIHAVLEFHNGALVTLGASWDVEAHQHSNMEIYGTDGSLYVPDPNFFGGELTLARRDGARDVVEPWKHPLGVANWERPNGPPFANYRTAGLADMMLAIDAGRKPRCSLETTLHGVDVMTSILKSGEIGEAITLTTTCERPDALGPVEAQALLV
ncbi:Gfo/Idh/MocA family oxidoreductase [Pelagibacterium nitratireducens]|jgi:predicted dehydrogenase|uniref:Gfo/Idh/MocA family oxidoreductase n=1 Tax=Pelagibacterium nitratireducens TaxID=1046114 RepID=A0ABZ2HV75_9HYPH|nr:oxidoreductase [Pelagibacterium sp.]HCO56072.1 oxidoreductase [Pelagibacterium sp.]|tara:strand:+ start:12472 stop:13608 length:1137 start_codon:yes stop_codon:yes gene_type:complete